MAFFAVTHLTNQHYTICIRREVGMCQICYIPSITAHTAVGDQVRVFFAITMYYIPQNSDYFYLMLILGIFWSQVSFSKNVHTVL